MIMRFMRLSKLYVNDNTSRCYWMSCYFLTLSSYFFFPYYSLSSVFLSTWLKLERERPRLSSPVPSTSLCTPPSPCKPTEFDGSLVAVVNAASGLLVVETSHVDW